MYAHLDKDIYLIEKKIKMKFNKNICIIAELQKTIRIIEKHSELLNINKITTEEIVYLYTLVDEIKQNIQNIDQLNNKLKYFKKLEDQAIEDLLLSLYAEYANIKWNTEYIYQNIDKLKKVIEN